MSPGHRAKTYDQLAKRVYPATADQAEPSNPHRPETCDLHPAGSFPGGFRTPAPVHPAASVMAGIRNPSQKLPFTCSQRVVFPRALPTILR
jgi:hypothetical protein